MTPEMADLIQALEEEGEVTIWTRAETSCGPLTLYPALVIERVNGRSAPRLQCQLCGRLIEDAAMANVTWPGLHREDDEVTGALVICKERCAMKQGIRYWPWQPLSASLLWLEANTGLRGEARKKAEAQAKRLSSLL
jgi:hypothetical protein